MGQTPTFPCTKANFQSMNSVKSSYKGPFLIKEKQTYVLKEMTFIDYSFFLKVKTMIDHLIKNKNVYILPIKEYWIEETELYCLNSFHISVLMEQYKRDLEAEIRIRKKTQKKFNDNEIFGLAYSVLKGLEYLNSVEKDYYYGGLNMNSVVLSKSGGVQIIEGRIDKIASGSVMGPINEGTIANDLKDLALILTKMLKLEVIEENDQKISFKNTKIVEFIQELQNANKPIKYYISSIKGLKEFLKDKKENKENPKLIIENYLSFGDKTNFNSQKEHIRNTNKQNLQKTKEIYEDGSSYEGQIYEALRNGQGTFVFSKGGMYKGQWNMGKMEGYGILYYISGKVAYEGEWKNDVFEGKGIILNEEIKGLEDAEVNYKDFGDIANRDLWKNYSGDFENDKKNGVGEMVFQTGEKLIGSWRMNQVDGSGTFYKKDGSIINGKWRENKMINEILI